MISPEVVHNIVNLEPSLETVDELVEELYGVHVDETGSTPWLYSCPQSSSSPHPDYYAHTRLRVCRNGWVVSSFMRDVGDQGYHYGTKLTQYYRYTEPPKAERYSVNMAQELEQDCEKLFKRKVHIGRFGYRPVVHEKQSDIETDPSELFMYMVKNWPVKRDKAMERYDEYETARSYPSPQEHRALMVGSFLMRRKERKVLGEAPKLGY